MDGVWMSIPWKMKGSERTYPDKDVYSVMKEMSIMCFFWNPRVYGNAGRNGLQLSLVAQSCPTLCDPMNGSMPGLPVHHQLPEFTQTHVHCRWCHPTISSSVVPFSSRLPSFPASGFFPMSQFFASGGQSIQLQYQSFQWIFRTDFL